MQSRYFIFRLSVFAILLITIWGFQVKPISHPDSSAVDTPLVLGSGQLLLDSNHRDSAAHFFHQTLRNYRNAQPSDSLAWEELLQLTVDLCQHLVKSGNDSLAIQQMDSLIFYARDTLKQPDSLITQANAAYAALYDSIGTQKWQQNQPISARAAFQRAVALKKGQLKQANPDWLYSFQRLSDISLWQKDPALALGYLRQAQQLLEEATTPDSLQLIALYDDFSTIYLMLDHLEEAQRFQQKSLELVLSDSTWAATDRAARYLSLARLFFQQNNPGDALAYLEKAESQWEASKVVRQPLLAEIYEARGTALLKLGDYWNALEQYNRALDIGDDVLEPSKPFISQIHKNIAITLSWLNNHNEAQRHFDRAITLLQESDSSRTVTGRYYTEWAAIFYQKNQLSRARDLYRQALSQWDSLTVPLLRIQAFNALASISQKQNNPERAFSDLQKAFSLNTGWPEDTLVLIRTVKTLTSTHSTYEYLKSAHLQTALLWQRFQKSKAREDLLAASKWHRSVSRLLDEIRAAAIGRADKLYLTENSASFYRMGAQLELQYYQRDSSDHLLRLAFRLLEKSHTSLFRQTLRHAEVRSFSGIPAGVIRREKNWMAQLSFYQQVLATASWKTELADSSLVDLWQQRVAELSVSFDSLVQVIREDYPGYYQVRYDTSAANIAEIQRQLPGHKTALLEYMVSENTVNVFILGKEHFDVISLDKNFPLEQWVDSYSRTLQDFGSSISSTSKWVDTGHQLYRHLVRPVEQAYPLPKKLIIIPDGPLCRIPFESFLQSRPLKKAVLRDFDFLVKKHQISYCYSSKLFSWMNNQNYGRTRGPFLAITTSDTEAVEPISRIMRGRVYADTLATKARFMEAAAHYRILHLELPATYSDPGVDQGLLYFKDHQDTMQPPLLFYRDLYRLQLNARLITLSHNQLAEPGRYPEQNLAFTGITGGFAYAGASSIISSLWRVDSPKKTELFKRFYGYLKMGKRKDEALHLAQLDFIKKYPQEAHPHYWAAFVATGDMAPIQPSYRYIMVLFFVVALIFIGYEARKAWKKK